MSYTIIYDRRFIRTEAGIIPLVLGGSNNCYQPNGRRWRRERDWFPLFHCGAMTEAELLAETEALCGGTYQEHFKWHGKWVDDNAFRAFVKNGIAQAKTLEEYSALNRWGIGVSTKLVCYSGDVREEKYGRFCRTSAELLEFLNEAKADSSAETYWQISFPYNEPLNIPQGTHIQGAVLAKMENLYIRNIGADSAIELTPDAGSAKVFDSVEKALENIKRIYYTHRLSFVKAQTPRKPMRFVVELTPNRYLSRLTSLRAKITYVAGNARKFPTERAAQKYIDTMLAGKFSSAQPRVIELKGE